MRARDRKKSTCEGSKTKAPIKKIYNKIYKIEENRIMIIIITITIKNDIKYNFTGRKNGSEIDKKTYTRTARRPGREEMN